MCNNIIIGKLQSIYILVKFVPCNASIICNIIFLALRITTHAEMMHYYMSMMSTVVCTIWKLCNIIVTKYEHGHPCTKCLQLYIPL